MTMDAVEFLKLASGNLDPMQAYFKGRIELAGDIMVAAKLAPAVPDPGGGGAAAAATAAARPTGPARGRPDGRPDDAVLAAARASAAPILDRMASPPPRRRSNCAPSSSASAS